MQIIFFFNSSHAVGVKHQVNLHIRSFKAFGFFGTYVTVLVHSFWERPISFWVPETRLCLPQANKFPSKRVRYLATMSSIFISSPSTGEFSALSKSETRFVEYSQNMPSEAFWTLNTLNYIHEAKVHPIKNQLYLWNTPNYFCEQMFTQLRTGLTTEREAWTQQQTLHNTIQTTRLLFKQTGVKQYTIQSMTAS